MSIHTSFPCKDCNRDFPTAEAFSNHFEREEGTAIIIGCEPDLFNHSSKPKKVEREA